ALRNAVYGQSDPDRSSIGQLVGARRVALEPMGETQLSQAAYDRLRTEYDDLTTRWRVEIAQKIERARELGDLSENGDYQAAKEEQGMKEARIRQLQALLDGAVIADAPTTGTTVANGSVVSL